MFNWTMTIIVCIRGLTQSELIPWPRTTLNQAGGAGHPDGSLATTNHLEGGITVLIPRSGDAIARERLQSLTMLWTSKEDPGTVTMRPWVVLYHQFQFYCYFRALSGLRTWATGIVFTAGGGDDDHGGDGALCVHQAVTPTVQVFRKRLEEGFLRTIFTVHTLPLLTFLECPRVRFSSFAHFMKLFQ